MLRTTLIFTLACLATVPAALAQEQNTVAADGSGGESWFSHAVYSPPASAWEARAGATFLRRSPLPQRTLAWTNIGVLSPEPELLIPLATTQDLNFKNQGGPEFSLLHHGESADIEFRWFQIQDFVARTPTLVGGQNGFVLTRIGPDIIETFGPTIFSGGYLSQLSSFELNARMPEQEGVFTPFCGFRYLEVNEELQESLFVPFGLFNYEPSVRSFNSLYGFQVGSDVELWNRGGPFQLVAVGKTGIYGNHATDRYRLLLNGQEGLPADAVRNSAAFVGELGIIGTWQLSQRLTARLGYEILWVDGIAQAALQQSQQALPTDEDVFAVNTHGSAYYHGVQLGLDYRW